MYVIVSTVCTTMDNIAIYGITNRLYSIYAWIKLSYAGPQYLRTNLPYRLHVNLMLVCTN